MQFPSGIFWGSLVEQKTKETLLLFCWTANRQTFYSVCVNQIPWKLREPIRRNQTGNAWQNAFCCRSTRVPVPVLNQFGIWSLPVLYPSIYPFSIHSVLFPFCQYSIGKCSWNSFRRMRFLETCLQVNASKELATLGKTVTLCVHARIQTINLHFGGKNVSPVTWKFRKRLFVM